MANYQYDESGVLASYFVLTFLTIILIPLTFTYLPSSKRSKSAEAEIAFQVVLVRSC